MGLGLPHNRTLVETGLHWVGLIGAGVGAIMAAICVIGYFLTIIGIGPSLLMYSLLPLFSLGAFGTVCGLFLAATAQFLGTLRIMAHNSANLETIE
jgi:hypothetical protein